MGNQIMGPGGMVDCFCDIGGCHWVVTGVFAKSVTGSVGLAALNATSRQQNALAVRPMITASTADATLSSVTNLRLAAHFTGDKQQGFVQHAALVQVFYQS